MDKNRIIKQLTEKYDKLYELEKQRREINKKIKLSRAGLYASLDYLRNEAKDKRRDKK